MLGERIKMLGERIKELRERDSILQKALAEEINVSQQTISLYESGKREPNHDTVIKIADYFNVSIDYLFGRKENSKSSDEKIVKGRAKEIIREIKEKIEELEKII